MCLNHIDPFVEMSHEENVSDCVSKSKYNESIDIRVHCTYVMKYLTDSDMYNYYIYTCTISVLPLTTVYIVSEVQVYTVL